MHQLNLKRRSHVLRSRSCVLDDETALSLAVVHASTLPHLKVKIKYINSLWARGRTVLTYLELVIYDVPTDL